MTPLSLTAVEKELQYFPHTTHKIGFAPCLRCMADATLVALRAHREALREFVMRLDDSELQPDGTRHRVSGVYAERARFERAAAVLATCED